MKNAKNRALKGIGAVISLTGEFVLHVINGEVGREYSPEIGLNLFKF